jgi:diguanylate cyclase (GGDEF)-like protein
MLIPLSAGFVQIIFFGVPLIWPAFTLATLISFNLVEVETFLKDSLTKLRTRGQFENRLIYMLKKRHCFSIIMIDLNDFKAINDEFGHEAGDEALLTTASLLEESVKKYDTVFRYGGDEFMILIESTKVNATDIVIQRISDEIDAHNIQLVNPFKLSFSFGCKYINPSNKETPKYILDKVDQLMYEDKKYRKKTA